MSEETQNTTQTLVIGLAVVAVLLAAIVGVLIYKQSTALPPVTAAPAVTPTGGSPMGGLPGAPTVTNGEVAVVDTKSATKVPKGTEPADFVAAYYKDCEKGDWKAAFDKLPASKKAGNSPDALQQQVSGYGVKSATVTGSSEQGDQLLVTAEQVTASYGTFVNTWTFSKKDGEWFVSDKAVTGMK